MRHFSSKTVTVRVFCRGNSKFLASISLVPSLGHLSGVTLCVRSQMLLFAKQNYRLMLTVRERLCDWRGSWLCSCSPLPQLILSRVLSRSRRRGLLGRQQQPTRKITSVFRRHLSLGRIPAEGPVVTTHQYLYPPRASGQSGVALTRSWHSSYYVRQTVSFFRAVLKLVMFMASNSRNCNILIDTCRWCRDDVSNL